MRWWLFGISVGGFASLWGMVPGHILFGAFLVMFANFATFCILYDRPKDRARLRVATQLRGMQANTDIAQRLMSAKLTTTEDDRHLGVTPLTVLNLSTGLVGLGLLIWGLVLRVF